MTWTGAAIFFAISWWLVFFTVLPWGVRTPGDVGEAAEIGHATSAPIRPRLGLKALVTTGITAVLLAIFALVVHYDLLDYREFIAQP
jgi:predicted secreted protein